MYAADGHWRSHQRRQVQEFAQIYAFEVLPRLESEPGFASARFMVEEGGRMAVSLRFGRRATIVSSTTGAARTGSSWRKRSTCWSEISS